MSADFVIDVVARDCDNATATLTYTARRDLQAPVLSIANLLLAPADNPASQTPFPIAGTITESNLAGFSANDQSIGVLPAGQGAYSFSFDVQLVHGPGHSVRLEAWDMAGNRSSATVHLTLQGNLEIELVSPADGSSFMAQGGAGSLDVVARIPGIAASDRVSARLDGGTAVPLGLSGDVARGTISAAVGEHTLLVTLESSTGQALGSRSVRFRVIDRAAIPLALSGSDPSNEQVGVEGNASLLLRLSRPIADPLSE